MKSRKWLSMLIDFELERYLQNVMPIQQISWNFVKTKGFTNKLYDSFSALKLCSRCVIFEHVFEH